jgi:SAM-dependent methyltransferase
MQGRADTPTPAAEHDDHRLAAALDEALEEADLRGAKVLAVGPEAASYAPRLGGRGADVTAGADGAAPQDRGALAFADSAFDLVLSADVVENSADPERAVRELVRVLRPGGTIVVVWPRGPWRAARRVAGGLPFGPARHSAPARAGGADLRRWLALRGVEPVRERGVQVLTSRRSSARLPLHVLVVGRKRDLAPS